LSPHDRGYVFEGLLGMSGLDELVWYGARVCLVAMFPFSAIDKIWHWKNALALTASDRLPGAKPMLILAMAVEFLTPICIVAGVYDRIAALLLAGFCVVTAFLYHPFWTYHDFWIESDKSQAREHFWQFLKNFGLVGGLLLVVFAGDLAPAQAVLSALFASSTHAHTAAP
jgi:putative oxidoreductase